MVGWLNKCLRPVSNIYRIVLAVIKRCWNCVTPNRCLIVLLAMECFLFLSEQFQWFEFNRGPGCAVVIALLAAGAGLVLMCAWFIARLLLHRQPTVRIVTLLLLIVSLVIPCSWLKSFREQYQQETMIEKETLEKIAMYGGKKDGEAGQGPLGLEWRVIGINFYDSAISDDGLLNVVPHLKRIHYLNSLNFTGTAITDRSVRTLVEELPRLRLLHFTETSITDDGIPYLAKFKDLHYLDISGTVVSDQSVAELLRLNALQYLQLDTVHGTTKITGSGKEALRRGLPKCRISP
jgi:hypothetical protein